MQFQNFLEQRKDMKRLIPAALLMPHLRLHTKIQEAKEHTIQDDVLRLIADQGTFVCREDFIFAHNGPSKAMPKTTRIRPETASYEFESPLIPSVSLIGLKASNTQHRQEDQKSRIALQSRPASIYIIVDNLVLYYEYAYIYQRQQRTIVRIMNPFAHTFREWEQAHLRKPRGLHDLVQLRMDHLSRIMRFPRTLADTRHAMVCKSRIEIDVVQCWIRQINLAKDNLSVKQSDEWDRILNQKFGAENLIIDGEHWIRSNQSDTFNPNTVVFGKDKRGNM